MGTGKNPPVWLKRCASEVGETAVLEKHLSSDFPTSLEHTRTHTLTNATRTYTRARGVGKTPVRVCEISPCQQHTPTSSFQPSILQAQQEKTQSEARKIVNSSSLIQDCDWCSLNVILTFTTQNFLVHPEHLNETAKNVIIFKIFMIMMSLSHSNLPTHIYMSTPIQYLAD